MIHPQFHSLTHLHPAHPLMPPQAAYALANASHKRRARRHLATADYRPCPNQHDVANKRSQKQEYVHRPRKHRLKLPKHMREPKAQLRPGKTTQTATRQPQSHSGIKMGKTHLTPKHILGPFENGTSQFSSSGLPIQRSGSNVCGSGKSVALWWTKVLPHATTACKFNTLVQPD